MAVKSRTALTRLGFPGPSASKGTTSFWPSKALEPFATANNVVLPASSTPTTTRIPDRIATRHYHHCQQLHTLFTRPSLPSATAIQSLTRSTSSSGLLLRASSPYPVFCAFQTLRRSIVTDVETASRGGKNRPLESWEEVEKHHLKIPTLDNYKRPKNAPLPTELTRADYHQFMRGKPRRWQQQTVCPAVGAALICFTFCEMAYAMFKLKPDDFDWIEEERARARAARERIDLELRRREKESKTEAKKILQGGEDVPGITGPVAPA
ncbi:unnamed protein product [Amoebophrya sp. A120]|nr:unnamed protein product [Amoebophrya sp. A120]|eukprot:GSA120T00002051001.1